MTTIAATGTAAANLRGILYMVIGMACFTCGDMFVKLAAERIPLGQVMIALGLGCGLVYSLILVRQGEPVFDRSFFAKWVMFRNLGEVFASTGMFLALAYSSLSTVSALTQTLPLLLTLFAALFLGEKIGIHRISAIIIGFIGVLVIIRPGTEGFDKYALWTMLAVVGMAMRDIGARLAPASISSIRLAQYAFLTTFPIGLVMLTASGGAKFPDITTSLYLLGLVTAASVGYFVVTQSVRIAEISVVSPFRYVRVLFAIILGVTVLGETIDIYTIIGSLITIIAGLYIWLREHGGSVR